MNILTDEEIWQAATDCTIGGDLHADKFARAIESAVLTKLSAGVSVEPDTHCFDTDTNLDVWSYSKDQLNTAIAAARVQENERCAVISTQFIGGDSTAREIRALVGKEST